MREVSKAKQTTDQGNNRGGNDFTPEIKSSQKKLLLHRPFSRRGRGRSQVVANHSREAVYSSQSQKGGTKQHKIPP